MLANLETLEPFHAIEAQVIDLTTSQKLLALGEHGSILPLEEFPYITTTGQQPFLGSPTPEEGLELTCDETDFYLHGSTPDIHGVSVDMIPFYVDSSEGDKDRNNDHAMVVALDKLRLVVIVGIPHIREDVNHVRGVVGIKNGLWLLWKETVDLKVIHSCDYAIQTLIHSRPPQVKWLCSFIHGVPERQFSSTVKDLKALLQPLTNVLPRGQKLIFKGKVLTDVATLGSSEIANGSKIMLMASQGLHQADGFITKASTTVSMSRIAVVNADRTGRDSGEKTIEKERLLRWKATGIVALNEMQLKAIPDELWTFAPSIRTLDLRKNAICEIPTKIGSLSSIKRLFLNENDLMDECICWEGVTSLKSLALLFLSQNYLTVLPSSLGALTSLKQLEIANNKLTGLPAEIGHLTQLETLKANNNRIASLPLSIGNCKSLYEINLSSNLLVDLPDTLGNLKKLTTFHLRNNGLKSLPSTLFKMCSELSTLDLHGTEITNDLLRTFEGWEDFDERRRSRVQKQLEFKIGCSDRFDEGADMNY
ncbi:hypothetical protein GIB67_017086 [Kingdonia uniflora]|uniref:Ubiquitin-like domain-containing protein n=1 Tax=Kingdonia uniflora TaxID=39325 RepID=A0A7J7NCS6_9MAGN|nr:hypothetical protein GIB67_017086 [Kingdonia uniflora]